MSTLRNTVNRSMIIYMAQRDIFCRVSGEVLDVRTCVVVLDPEGDPAQVLSPEGWKTLEELGKDDEIFAHGYTLMER